MTVHAKTECVGSALKVVSIKATPHSNTVIVDLQRVNFPHADLGNLVYSAKEDSALLDVAKTAFVSRDTVVSPTDH